MHSALEDLQRDKTEKTTRAVLQELEDALNDSRYRQELHDQQCGALKEEIRRLDSNSKREGANLEFLKENIVRYMSNQVGKEQTVQAIAMILQFSRKELALVTAAPKSWFGSS